MTFRDAPRFPTTLPVPSKARERGISLFVVIVFVMLSMLLALWASRTSLFSEWIVGNDTDYQRAFEAAQALIQDAELDIREENAKGALCAAPAGDGGRVCRKGAAMPRPPLEAQETIQLLAYLQSQATGCKDGLCLKRSGDQDFWNDPATLQAMAVDGIGARFGDYTGAKTGNNSNPILSNTSSATAGGWYWVEVLPYVENGGNAGLISNAPANYLPLHMVPNVVYRITAIAYGLKPGSMVVLQQSYARRKAAD
ncbi:hypothetical protein SDC9_124625 [bioreactor metagenome]|uniref:Uncharacterized protein n=1 Tax=bioreactor metagenome TaxID=1076179 RepID=A0A645CL41_9ZZZZ